MSPTCIDCGDAPVMEPSPWGDGSDTYDVCEGCYDPTPVYAPLG